MATGTVTVTVTANNTIAIYLRHYVTQIQKAYTKYFTIYEGTRVGKKCRLNHIEYTAKNAQVDATLIYLIKQD